MIDPDQIAGCLLIAFAFACLFISGWRELSRWSAEQVAQQVRAADRAEAAERLVRATANQDFYDSRGITR